MNREDPKIVVKELLKREWDERATLGVSPDFRTGWRDANLSAPQVTLGPDDASALNDTGFDGINPDGSGPTSTYRGTVQVHAWASREITDENPKQLTSKYMDEAERIVGDHYGISAYTDESGQGIDGTDPYRYISWLGDTFMPGDDEDDNPSSVVEFHYVGEVRFEYHDGRR